MTTATFNAYFSSLPWSPSSSTVSSSNFSINTPYSTVSSPLSYHHQQIDDSFRPSSEEWRFALGCIKQQMYNSTGAGLPCPGSFMARNHPLPENDKGYLDISTGDDISGYRQVRSERLVRYMFRCMDVNIDISSIINLGKGVYIHHVAQAPVEFGDPFDDLLNQIMQTAFVPYSYSLGARYTDALGYTSDIVIRGNMPAWVQSLFLTECFRQETPIRPGDSRRGLFTFAPSIAVEFKTLDSHPQQYIINPELTLIYEKVALDLTDPDALYSEGALQKSAILKRVLVCDIPDELAQVLTELAAAWASSQGLTL
ncbi:hypothetical protein BX666DRAFT_2024896 [Dichotomocladium elegans]|nr:hypothetical protein BX666DRAFT_2024896 [Dichotomocladium elegans]